MVKTPQWILAHKPTGLPSVSGSDATFKLSETETESLKENQLLVKILYLSNDPAQRGWISPDIQADRLYVPPVELGQPMNARGIAEVIESNSPKFKKGDHVLAPTGWSYYRVVDAAACQPSAPLPNGLSETHYLGALGLTGLTAYYGLKEVVRTTADDVVVVSGAAGATGSMCVQIAKHIVGSKKVIGIAGSDEKCRWVESLGADVCVNYKSPSFADDLKRATPDYANVYYDNVGGDILDLMLTRMAKYGRVAACGAITNYNNSGDKTIGLKNWFEIITMRLEVRGFIVLDYLKHAAECMEVFKKALAEGKLKIDKNSEHVVEGKFEDVPKVWLKLFEGANQGKLITKIV